MLVTSQIVNLKMFENIWRLRKCGGKILERYHLWYNKSQSYAIELPSICHFKRAYDIQSLLTTCETPS